MVEMEGSSLVVRKLLSLLEASFDNVLMREFVGSHLEAVVVESERHRTYFMRLHPVQDEPRLQVHQARRTICKMCILEMGDDKRE